MREKNPYSSPELADIEKDELTEWNEEWKKQIVKDLSWEEYNDPDIKVQVDCAMEKMFEWFRLGILATGKTREMKWIREQASEAADGGQREAKRPRKEDEGPPFDEKVANHLSRLAQMLSNRTDDPKTGVGCVIAIKDEIVAIGWNGFPSKALYGNHPRGGSKKTDGEVNQKYPHVIHAEQNALMCRNRIELKETESIAFVNRIPCNECLPMLYDVGVKTIVLPHFEKRAEKPSETSFFSLLKKPNGLTVYKQIKEEN
jgi:dCMP deaminase